MTKSGSSQFPAKKGNSAAPLHTICTRNRTRSAAVSDTIDGQFRAWVNIDGKRASAIFNTRSEANTWIAITEAKFRNGGAPQKAHQQTLVELIERYIKEVSPCKRCGAHEAMRMSALMRDNPELANTGLSDLTPQHFADLRDRRLDEVKPGSVRRELSALSAVLEYARKEWGLIKNNPLRDISKPANPQHRERTLQVKEIRALLKAAKYRPGSSCITQTEAVARAMLLAIRTGMLPGEICDLRWTDVHDQYLFVHGKRPGLARNVPLSRQARRIINDLRGWDETFVIGVTLSSLDALFRKLRTRTQLSGFTFQDTRHTAATMLSRKLNVLELCQMIGWQDSTRAMIYYNPTATEIAMRLDSRIRQPVGTAATA